MYKSNGTDRARISELRNYKIEAEETIKQAIERFTGKTGLKINRIDYRYAFPEDSGKIFKSKIHLDVTI